MNNRLPFANTASANSVSSPSGILFLGLPGYKISLRGLQITVQTAPTVSGIATLAFGQFASTNNKLGYGPYGNFTLTFLPSATEAQYFSYEFPEGCMETVGFPVSAIQGPAGQPYTIPYQLTPAGSDNFDVDINYWGQFAPVPE